MRELDERLVARAMIQFKYEVVARLVRTVRVLARRKIVELSLWATALLTFVVAPTLAKSVSVHEARMFGHAVFCHAGSVEGDGEYTDGAVYRVQNISCRHALALIKPTYPQLVSHETRNFGRFRVGKFACHYMLSGPARIKTCMHRKQRFQFL